MKVNSPEYNSLKAFLGNAGPLVFGKPFRPMEDPVVNLERLEKVVPARAVEGLLMAIDDLLSRSMHLSQQKIAEFDRTLLAMGCFTFATVMVKYWKKLERLLRSNKKLREPDYYFLKSLYEDTGIQFDEKSKIQIVRLLHEFENGKA